MTLYENIAESLWQSCLNEDLGSAELYIQKLNEKALFGSMASSIKKWQKQIIQLTYEIKWLESGKMTPEVAQAVDSAPNVPIEQVETVTAAKAEVLPEIQQAMPEATPDVQDSVAEYAAKYGAEISTTPQGDIELSYEDGTAEIIKDSTGEGDLVAVDADTGIPVEEVTPQEIPEGAAEQAVSAGEPVTAQAGALDANNFAERAASAGIKSKDFTYMRINALEMKDGGTIYDIRPGMELTVPKGADYGIVSLKQGYVLDTTSGNIIKQPADYMQHVFDKPPKYLGSMSFGHEVMKLSDIKI